MHKTVHINCVYIIEIRSIHSFVLINWIYVSTFVCIKGIEIANFKGPNTHNSERYNMVSHSHNKCKHKA